MVKIRKMSSLGDSVEEYSIDEAKKVIVDYIEEGNVVFDEDEKKIVTKATMGQVKDNTNVGIFPAVQGG